MYFGRVLRFSTVSKSQLNMHPLRQGPKPFYVCRGAMTVLCNQDGRSFCFGSIQPAAKIKASDQHLHTNRSLSQSQSLLNANDFFACWNDQPLMRSRAFSLRLFTLNMHKSPLWTTDFTEKQREDTAKIWMSCLVFYKLSFGSRSLLYQCLHIWDGETSFLQSCLSFKCCVLKRWTSRYWCLQGGNRKYQGRTKPLHTQTV